MMVEMRSPEDLTVIELIREARREIQAYLRKQSTGGPTHLNCSAAPSCCKTSRHGPVFTNCTMLWSARGFSAAPQLCMESWKRS